MIVADSDVLIDFLRGRGEVARRVAIELETRSFGTTAITAFEIRSGARTARQKRSIDTLLEAMTILPFGPEAVAAVGTRSRIAPWPRAAAYPQAGMARDTWSTPDRRMAERVARALLALDMPKSIFRDLHHRNTLRDSEGAAERDAGRCQFVRPGGAGETQGSAGFAGLSYTRPRRDQKNPPPPNMTTSRMTMRMVVLSMSDPWRRRSSLFRSGGCRCQ